jgi:hypothetical protein
VDDGYLAPSPDPRPASDEPAEPLLRRIATHEIDTPRPLAEEVEEVGLG